MCGTSKPTQQYQGKTYRREAITDFTPYANAWKDGDSSQTLGSNINAASKRQASTYQASNNGPLGMAIPGNSQPSIMGKAIMGSRPDTSYDYAAHANAGVYGADDGSFISSTFTKGRGANPMTQTGGKDSVESFRYIEDAKGTYGATGYSAKGAPKGFSSLDGQAIYSTSNAQGKLSAPQGEPNKATIQQTAKKRKGSVGTSKFKIDIGGTTRSSGLGIPT